jgi:hypothetical protein
LARPQAKDEASTALHLTVQATVMGTPINMSPEQFDDPLGVDHRTDIYSLGCVLYDMLTAKPAFTERTLSTLLAAKHRAVRGPDPRLARTGLHPDVSELVMRMLAAKREDRPQTYAELIETCERLVGQLGGPRAPAPARNRAPVFAAAGAVSLLGAAGIWWALGGARNGAPPPVDFGLRIEPPTAPREGQDVTLTALVAGVEGGLPALDWQQVSGPAVTLSRDGATATFTAPYAREEYELGFVVRGESAGKTAESPALTFFVAAQDDDPSVEALGARRAMEHERVVLTASVVDPDEHGEFEFAWTQTSGPSVELQAERERVAFTAPEAAAAYEVGLALEASAGGRRWSAAPVAVAVAAVNDPPTVTLHAPAAAEAGDEVQLVADVSDVDSPNDLKHEWRVASPAGLAVAFDAPTSRKARFAAPEHPAGDYELVLEFAVRDAAQEPVRSTVAIAVKCDPALNALEQGKSVTWLSPTSLSGDGLSGWSSSRPAPKLALSPDGILVGSPDGATEGEASITRELPRGTFALTVLLQPQGLKTLRSGLRLVGRDQQAVDVGFLPNEPGSEECTLVAYATAPVDGGFPLPAPEKRMALSPWSLYETLELEITWDGTSSKARWRAPDSGTWSEFATLGLASRPRSVALFVNRGMLTVSSVVVRGP